MKFECDRNILKQAVSNILPAVAAKATPAVLEGVLLIAQGGGIQLAGYDLDLGISKTIEAKISEQGAVVLNARIFFDILNKLPSRKISVAVDDKLATVIRGGDTEFFVIGMDAKEFPELPQTGSERSFFISSETLRTMASQTMFAAAQSDATPIHTGVLFDIKGGTFNMAALDGYCLAVSNRKIEGKERFKFVVPAKTLSEILKLLPKNDEAVQIYVGTRHISLQTDGYSIIARLLEGTFFDYNSAIPKKYMSRAIVNVKEMIGCIERASIIISDRLKSPVIAQFEIDKVNISCTSSAGKINDSTAVKYEGEPLKIGFNNKYMTDMLKACGCDEVALVMSGATSPIKIVPAHGSGFVSLVLPCRLKN